MLPYNMHKPLFSPKISAILYQFFFTFCCLQITSLQAYIQFRKLRKLILAAVKLVNMNRKPGNIELKYEMQCGVFPNTTRNQTITDNLTNIPT